MVKIETFLAVSAFGLGALGHPAATTKHTDRFCSFDERNVFARDALKTRATIPKATTWNPPASMVTALDQVWKQTMVENPDGLKDMNWITDQLMANKGNINYCVRWNHSGKSTAAVRAGITRALQRALKKWFDLLVGFEGFPLTTLNVKVVGYAVKNRSILEGDIKGLDVYTGKVDPDGVPECDPGCYRGAHLDGDFSQCPGGAARRYDMSFWIDDSLASSLGGLGYNWGQELGPKYVFDNLEAEDMHILQHEMGHGFGLLDFYDWEPQGQSSFIMMAGSAMEIKEFDAWMLRDWWRKMKPVRGW